MTYAEHVGYGARFEDGFSRNVFACHLECGHGSLVTAREAPFKVDCMRCGDGPVQVMLPLALPRMDRRASREGEAHQAVSGLSLPPVLKRNGGLYP